MNLLFERLKQNFQNNYWYEENVHTQHIKTALIASYDYPDLTKVWGNDTSHWDAVVNQRFAKQAGTHFTFIKAIDGTIPTKYFSENRVSAIQNNIITGAYAWLYPNNRVDCKAQALAFHNLLNNQPVELPPVIDFEKTFYGGLVASPNYTDLKLWATEFNRLGNRTGNRRPLLYSSAGYMNQYGQIPADLKALFCGIWIANYTTRYTPTMPIGYGVNEWLFWQWSCTGDQANLAPSSANKKELDLNYFYGTQEQLLALVGKSQTISDGYQKVRLYNSDIHIWRGSVSKVKVTDNGGTLKKPSSFVSSGAAVIINGDGWLKNAGITHHLPLSLAASDGKIIQDMQYDFRPFFNSSVHNKFDITDVKLTPYNQVSGTRYSVKSGVNPYALATDPEYVTERHPRTALGFTQNNKLIACVVDGRSTISAGVTLKELADIMISAGAWYGLELDGGDSSVMLVDGVQVSKNGDLVNGVKVERATVNSVLFFKGVSVMKQYQVIWDAGVNKRTGPTTSAGATGAVVPDNTIVDVLEDNIPDQTYPTDSNKKWVKFTDGTFGASIYGAGSIRMELVNTPPPPVQTFATLNITVTDPVTGARYGADNIQLPKLP